MDLDTHPNPQPNPHHRKIDLQSPHDLTYLQENLAQSALQKLDLHFPKISQPATHISLGGTQSNGNNNNNTTKVPSTQPQTSNANENDNNEPEDPMRRRVRDLVTEFLTKTWTTASQNIAVNGTDAYTIPLPHTATLSDAPVPTLSSLSTTDIQEEQAEIEGVHYQHAAFDGSLQRRLAALHGELEALTAQVSRLRRTAPGQSAVLYESRLKAALDADDMWYEDGIREGLDEHGNVGVERLKVDDTRTGWNEDVREMYELGVGELAGLASGGTVGGVRVPTLTETVGKAQRARKVAMELE